MAKPDWGNKLKCQSCGAAFYDLNQAKPVCPKCDTEYTPAVKGRRGASAAAPVASAKISAIKSPDDSLDEDIVLEDDDDIDDVLDDDEEDEGLIEDTSDLDDDDDDMAEIKEHVEADIDDKD